MSETIETPEGWERQGPCFTRARGEKLAVLELDETLDGAYPMVFSQRGLHHSCGFLLFNDAVAWANAQLGVPQPVDVVRKEYGDAWMLTCEQTGRSWRVSKDVRWRDYPDINVALRVGEKYVRGDA